MESSRGSHATSTYTYSQLYLQMCTYINTYTQHTYTCTKTVCYEASYQGSWFLLGKIYRERDVSTNFQVNNHSRTSLHTSKERVYVWHHFWLITLIVLPCVVCYLHSYMSIVESLPTYGVHYYAVKVSELIGWSLPTLSWKSKQANRKFSCLLVWRFGGEWELMEVGLVKRLLARGNWATEFYP